MNILEQARSDVLNQTQMPLIKQCMDASAEQFRAYLGGGAEVIAEPLENKFGVLAPWTVISLLSSEDYALTFKIHFSIKNVASLMRVSVDAFNEAAIESFQTKAFEFIKNFALAFTESLKAGFENEKRKVSLSLPILTRGFDQIFFKKADNQKTFEEFWILKSAESQVQCSLFLEIFDLSKVDEISAGLRSKSKGATNCQ